MRRRKRATILATMVATGLIGIAALGGGSASADVLCKDVAFNYNCSAEKTYVVGSEFDASAGSAFKVQAGTSGENLMATCASSSLDWTLTNAGGSFETAYPEVDTTSMNISGCGGDDSISVVSDGGGKISQLSIGSASQKGRFYPSGLQIKVVSNWFFNGYFGFAECTYKVVGPATIEGAKTNEYGEPRIVFSEAFAETVSKVGYGCYDNARFSGRYVFEPDMYVVPQ